MLQADLIREALAGYARAGEVIETERAERLARMSPEQARAIYDYVTIEKLHDGSYRFLYHPELLTFPHHKHIGPQDRVAPSDQPSLSQVLAEIASWLGEQ